MVASLINPNAKNRLTNWLRGNGDAQNWDLSFEGNWDQNDGDFTASGGVAFDQARTHNAPHEILAVDPDNDPMTANSVTFTHDPKGNLTQDDTGLQLTFDFDNHLKQVIVSGSAKRGTEGSHTYEYDALGRRIAKTVDTDADFTPDETTVFVRAGQQILAEYDENTGLASTTPVRKYIYCATCYIDEPIALVDDASGGDVYYYHRDRSYNVIGLTDDAGTIVELYAYTLYGERTIFNDSWTAIAASAFGNQRGFQGLRHDAESGLIENRARVLDPLTGRFIQRDPHPDVYPDGMNTYAAYHVMRGGVDPIGLRVEFRPTAPPNGGGGVGGHSLADLHWVDEPTFQEKHGKKSKNPTSRSIVAGMVAEQLVTRTASAFYSWVFKEIMDFGVEWGVKTQIELLCTGAGSDFGAGEIWRVGKGIRGHFDGAVNIKTAPTQFHNIFPTDWKSAVKTLLGAPDLNIEVETNMRMMFSMSCDCPERINWTLQPIVKVNTNLGVNARNVGEISNHGTLEGSVGKSLATLCCQSIAHRE